ncbi:type II toxin-antitoxin system RelE/ParE family toxin [Glaesserella parasuis]|uniref:type II toxin-antitoxin system RelE family toxin n=1 Tax=Glaesserella parasuis TaxID=738 RepID=UPI0013236E2C|nr:type II toxin-antitoxin system RelE/ParE family toxin [Glaesserella parasuis]MWQ00547.1 type II toxin-antitoxin system RelE/ParE family toxin [Glaesserella parasuis]MWQ45870.1 type II toxin-antitoxin system RelE/ParE family toxin [Glaesserella parasuis]MWQ62749.1 type II toxin-antitoxin system RelE/ParE family toxin [Glaesserella parasuis]
MSNKIIISSKADKQLDRIDSRYKKSIIETISMLVNFPDVTLDITKLKGYLSKYRARVGRYRIIFEWIEGVPKIIEIQEIKKRDERTYN